MKDEIGSTGVLIIGRALHPPWNEGIRVICRDFSRITRSFRPVYAVSLSDKTIHDQDDAELKPVHVYTQAKRWFVGDYLSLPSVIRRARSIIAANRIGVAHLFAGPEMLAPWLQRQGIRVVVHISLTEQVYIGRLGRLRIARGWPLFDRWVDAYACTTEQIRNDLKTQGYHPEKLHIVPPLIDLQRFHQIDRAAARQKFGFAPDAFVVGYIGTVSPSRFPAREVIKGLSLLTSRIPNLELEVFAPVATHQYNLAWADENVRQAASAAALPVNVHLRDLTEEEKVEVYNAADVMLLPFSGPVAVEPPLTLLEAMACQAPVAVTHYANRAVVVEDGVNGVIFNSAEELAEQLARLYALGPELRLELGKEARKFVGRQYSFATAARAVQTVWASIGSPDTEGSYAPY